MPVGHRGARPPTSPRLVSMSPPDAGATHPLDGGVTSIGRDADNDVPLDDATVSRHHCEVVRDEGTVTVVDLHSTNGTFVAGVRLAPGQAAPLEPGALLEVGARLFKLVHDDAETAYHESMQERARTDALTGLANRACLIEFLDQELARNRRAGTAVSLVLVDVDHFKGVNDTWGHVAGDGVLRRVGEHLRGRIRRVDCAARYGGDEFAVVLHDAGSAQALAFAEELRSALAAIDHDPGESVTVSAGVAEATSDVDSPEDLVRAADERLYAAKRSGRDRVVG